MNQTISMSCLMFNLVRTVSDRMNTRLYILARLVDVSLNLKKIVKFMNVIGPKRGTSQFTASFATVSSKMKHPSSNT